MDQCCPDMLCESFLCVFPFLNLNNDPRSTPPAAKTICTVHKGQSVLSTSTSTPFSYMKLKSLWGHRIVNCHISPCNVFLLTKG